MAKKLRLSKEEAERRIRERGRRYRRTHLAELRAANAAWKARPGVREYLREYNRAYYARNSGKS